MMRLFYASDVDAQNALGYFFVPHGSVGMEFDGAEEVREALLLAQLGNDIPRPVHHLDVTLLCITHKPARHYLLTSPTIMVVKVDDMLGLNSDLGSVVESWENGGKVTLPNPFYIGDLTNE